MLGGQQRGQPARRGADQHHRQRARTGPGRDLVDQRDDGLGVGLVPRPIRQVGHGPRKPASARRLASTTCCSGDRVKPCATTATPRGTPAACTIEHGGRSASPSGRVCTDTAATAALAVSANRTIKRSSAGTLDMPARMLMANARAPALPTEAANGGARPGVRPRSRAAAMLDGSCRLGSGTLREFDLDGHPAGSCSRLAWSRWCWAVARWHLRGADLSAFDRPTGERFSRATRPAPRSRRWSHRWAASGSCCRACRCASARRCCASTWTKSLPTASSMRASRRWMLAACLANGCWRPGPTRRGARCTSTAAPSSWAARAATAR